MSGYKGEGIPFSIDNPTIKEFREIFEACAKEISVDGVNIDSHKIPTSVSVRYINTDEKYYNIVGISIDYLFGCGCPSTLVIEIEEEL